MRPSLPAWAAAVLLLGLAGCSNSKLKPRPVAVRQLVSPEKPVDFHLAMARAYAKQRAFAPAFVHIREAKRRAPERADVYYTSGYVLRDARLYADAERDLKEALRIDKKLAAAWNALGILYDLTDRPALADEALRKATKLAPKEAAYHNDLGFSLYLRGKYVESVEHFRRALRLQPTLARARNNLGFAYGRLGHYGRAYREFERANPRPQALNNIGLVYELHKKHDRAIEMYVEAIKAEPRLRAARGNLTALCQRLGRKVPPLPAVPAPASPKSTAAPPDPAASPKRPENAPTSAAGPLPAQRR